MSDHLHLVDLVNPLQGTDSEHGFSRGNTLPLVARPFAMTHWSPQTDEGRWLFQRRAPKLQGIRATRQPSPWISDYGHFTVMPTTGPLMIDPSRWSSFYRQNESVFGPDYFRATLFRYQIDLEAACTDRCACIRATFPAADEARFIIRLFPGDSEITVDPESGMVCGYTAAGARGAKDFAAYFLIQADRPITGGGVFDGSGVRQGETALRGDAASAFIEFDASQGEQVTLRVATSFISIEQARRNLDTELGGRTLEEVREESREIWERELSRIEIDGGTEDEHRTFYTCLYRALLFPRKLAEIDGDGNMVHYSPYTGKVHEGELTTDNGFWDTYRTVYSLLALIAPNHLGEIMRGWTNGANEGGWFPRWASPGYLDCMIGTHMDVIVPDVYLRGITDFDIQAAYDAIRRDAFEEGDAGGGYGRKGIRQYLELGYVPADEVDTSVSRTLDYAYNDFGVAQLAHALGRAEDAELLYRRAMNYRGMYDPGVGFMRGRNRDGSWLEPFEEFAWGRTYVEGGPWQSTWAVQHDPTGLIELMGGRQAFVDKLDRMLSIPPFYSTGGYGAEIHEMTEMAAASFGQYAHSNQPVHHVLFLYTAAGRPDRTQYWVRRVMSELYGPDDLAGDEDNGEMCGWYILNALGIYPLCPGEPSFVLGSPLFPRTTVYLENGQTLTVEAPGNTSDTFYVQKVEWNGATHRQTWIAHKELAAGGTLRFTMASAAPPAADPRDEDLPYSLSRILPD